MANLEQSVVAELLLFYRVEYGVDVVVVD